MRMKPPFVPFLKRLTAAQLRKFRARMARLRRRFHATHQIAPAPHMALPGESHRTQSCHNCGRMATMPCIILICDNVLCQQCWQHWPACNSCRSIFQHLSERR